MNRQRVQWSLVLSLLCLPFGAHAQQMSQAEIATSYARSFSHERSQDYDNAIRSLGDVYQAYPNGYTVNLRMGWLFYLNGNHNNAVAHYEVAARVAPQALEPRLGRLLPLLAQGRWVEAETVAYQVISVDHYNYFGNLRLAFALRMQGKVEQAYQVVLKMVGAYPTDLAYLVELAEIQQARGNETEALAILEDVLILDPENLTARRILGVRP